MGYGSNGKKSEKSKADIRPEKEILVCVRVLGTNEE